MALSLAALTAQIDVTRDIWDPTEVSRHSRYGERSYESITGVEVHWVGTGAVADHGDTSTELEAFERYHEVTKGWYDLFYQFAIDSEGFTYEGRNATIPSQSDLKNWLTCLFVLGEDDPPPPLVMYQRLYDVWGAVDPSRNPSTLRFHGERSSTGCPGPDIETGVRLLRSGWNPYGEGSQGVPVTTIQFSDLPKKNAPVAVWEEIDNLDSTITDGTNPTDLAARWEAMLMSDRALRTSKGFTDRRMSQAVEMAKKAAVAGDAQLQIKIDQLAAALEQFRLALDGLVPPDPVEMDIDLLVDRVATKVLAQLDGTSVVIEQRYDAVLDI